MTELDLGSFFRACNPSKTLVLGKSEDKQYYIDFSTVRGEHIINKLERTITKISPNQPTCQLFTGYIGCGKSTELLQLKDQLEKHNFHVIYLDSNEDLVMTDVDITDILLAISRQVSENLEQANITLQPRIFKSMLQEVIRQIEEPSKATILQSDEISINSEEELSLNKCLDRLTAKVKNIPELRFKLRDYLESRTDTLVDIINRELFTPAINQLKLREKKGLVLLVDSLDRVVNTLKPSGRTQQKYLFLDRGEDLKKLNCHVVYTIPLRVTLSNDLELLKNSFGDYPKILPIVRVQLRDGSDDEEGIKLLQQMILARAFPKELPEQRLLLIEKVFDSSETLIRLCQVSGGHLRNLMSMLYGCLQKEDPPLSHKCLEEVILNQHNTILRAIDDNEWQLLRKVKQDQIVKGEEKYLTLLRNGYVFEYRDAMGSWFTVNPILLEGNKFASVWDILDIKDPELSAKHINLLLELEKLRAANIRELEIKTSRIGENLRAELDFLQKRGLVKKSLSSQAVIGHEIYQISPNWRQLIHTAKKA